MASVRVSCAGCGWQSHRTYRECEHDYSMCSCAGWGECPRCKARVYPPEIQRRFKENDKRVEKMLAQGNGGTQMATTTDQDDAKVLRYCLGGHEYAGCCDTTPEPEYGRTGTRRVFCEAGSKQRVLDSAGPKMTNVRVYRRDRYGWTLA